MKRFSFFELQAMAKDGNAIILFTGLTGQQEDVLKWDAACLPINGAQFELDYQTEGGGCRWYKYIG